MPWPPQPYGNQLKLPINVFSNDLKYLLGEYVDKYSQDWVGVRWNRNVSVG